MSTPAPSRPQPEPRSAYRAFCPISTRWSDNDVYGHVNNVVYYSWFDTAVNSHLMARGVLDIHAGQSIGLVVQTQCDYFAPLAFPQACATRWPCLRPTVQRTPCARPKATLCMCMWTAKAAVRAHWHLNF